ncbi:hypothetical protein VT84_14070 [Gemmata sp. SH-PL17]|nr:hypothetical protein VT84_14070 [Gemmata sp. SH-PL17]
MEPTAQQPTDRDLLVALIGLVGALAERVTGSRPVLRVEFGEGQFVNVTPGDVVNWSPGAVPNRCGLRQV